MFDPQSSFLIIENIINVINLVAMLILWPYQAVFSNSDNLNTYNIIIVTITFFNMIIALNTSFYERG